MDKIFQEIIDINKLEYGELPNYNKAYDWEKKEEIVIFKSYTERLKNILKDSISPNGKKLTPIFITEDCHKNLYPKVFTEENSETLPGYKVEIYAISFGLGYWAYHLYKVYKNDILLFNLVNYAPHEFAMGTTPYGDFFVFSENFDTITIVDIKNMKIYGHKTGICPWEKPLVFYKEDSDCLYIGVEGCYSDAEGDPKYIELNINLKEPFSFDSLTIRDSEKDYDDDDSWDDEDDDWDDGTEC